MEFSIDFKSETAFNRIELKSNYDARPNRNKPKADLGYVRSMDHPRAFEVTLFNANGEQESFNLQDGTPEDAVTDICFDSVKSAHKITVRLTEGHDHYWWSIRDVNLYHVTTDDLPASIPEEVHCPDDQVLLSVDLESEDNQNIDSLKANCVSMSDYTQSSNHSAVPTKKPVRTTRGVGAVPSEQEPPSITYTTHGNTLRSAETDTILPPCENSENLPTGVKMTYDTKKQAYQIDEIEPICGQSAEVLECEFPNRVDSVLLHEGAKQEPGASVRCVTPPTEGGGAELTSIITSEHYDRNKPHTLYESIGASLTNPQTGESRLSCGEGKSITGLTLRYEHQSLQPVLENPQCAEYTSSGALASVEEPATEQH